MLQARIFNEINNESNDVEYNKPWKEFHSIFRASYPRMPELKSIIGKLPEREKNYTLDLRPVMNPSAYSVCHAASFNRIFKLFRALGLRHIVVLNDYNEVVGIVTRKDLAYYSEGGGHSSDGRHSSAGRH